MANRGGEYIYHVNAVRLRVVGLGNLQLGLYSLDDVRSYTMLPLVMQAETNIEPARLANFRSQRTQLEIKVTEINEWFQIQKIVVFAKASATAYPQ